MDDNKETVVLSKAQRNLRSIADVAAAHGCEVVFEEQQGGNEVVGLALFQNDDTVLTVVLAAAASAEELEQIGNGAQAFIDGAHAEEDPGMENAEERLRQALTPLGQPAEVVSGS